MPINLHISGETANEFQDALTAVLGLLGSPTLAAAAENKIVIGETSTPAPEPKAAPARKPRETKKDEAATATADTATTQAGSTETSTSAPADAPQETSTPASEQIVDNDPPAEVKKLDFDKEVAPKVLGYVRHKGKPWVEEILSEFGVKRASDLDDDRLPELLETLEDRGGELPK